MLKLYDFPRSSACYRVRVALNLKNVPYERLPIDLLKGEQKNAGYKTVNPQELIPALDTGSGILGQSLAIIEYLEEKYPNPALLPKDPMDRARVRAMALAVAADLHPLQVIRVGGYLRDRLGQSEDVVKTWNCDWIQTGLNSFQDLVEGAPVQGEYCYGNTVTLADVLLVPQLVNAKRFQCDFSGLKRLVDIETALLQLPAFATAAPPPA